MESTGTKLEEASTVRSRNSFMDVTQTILMFVLTCFVGVSAWFIKTWFTGLSGKVTTLASDNTTAHRRMHESIDSFKAEVSKDFRSHEGRISSLETTRRNAKTQHVQSS